MLAYLQTGWHYLWNILRPRRKLGWRGFVVMGVIALAVVLVTSPLAHADLIDTVVGVLADIILWIATLFLKLSIFCLTFIIDVAGYNGYLDSMAVNYGWVMVRDLTNMIFVVILLLIAFGTILGIEQYEWKKMLVKFVAAAILVNFSRIICGVIIDVGQVVMITFINGVAATAGGNLINAFGAGEIMTLAEGGSTAATPGEVFLAAVMAVVFAGMMLMTMLVYLVILVARMVQLWVLIVLSPFAFVFSVIPTTQKYASEWWQKFGSNVVSGPIVAFFLWLSFVTVGGGTVGDEVHKASATKKDVNDGTQSAGITKAMSWAKMANFAIAIGMLLVGAETAQKLGVTGGSMMSKVGDFGKKAAMIASGVALGKWVGGKAKQGGKFLGKKTLMNVPLVGGHAWQRYGAQIKNKAIIAGTKWNEKVGSRLGSIAQFGAHEKIMKERKAQAEQLLGSMSSSAKGRQNEFFKDKEGNLVKRKAYKADGTEDKEALFGIEKVRAYTDLIQGEGKIKKEASEAVRRERIAKAGAGKVDKVYAEKIAGATTAETNLTTAKTKVEIDFLNDPKSKGGALVEARANANSWDTNKQKQMMSMLGVIRSKRAKAAEEVVAGIGGDTRAKNAQLNKDRATFFEQEIARSKADKAKLALGQMEAIKDSRNQGDAQVVLESLPDEIKKILTDPKIAVREDDKELDAAMYQRILKNIVQEENVKAGGVTNNAVVESKRAELLAREHEVNEALEHDEEKYKAAAVGNPELAAAFYDVIEKENGIMLKRNTDFLTQAMRQGVVGNARGISYPKAEYAAVVDNLMHEFAGMDKPQMLSAAEHTQQRIVEKLKKPGYEFTPEHDMDQLYADAAMAKLFEQRFMDDPSGTSNNAEHKIFNEEAERIGKIGDGKSAVNGEMIFNNGIKGKAPKINTGSGGELDLMSVLTDFNSGERNNLKKALGDIVTKMGASNISGLKAALSGDGLNKALNHLQTVDVSANHWRDKVNQKNVTDLLKKLYHSTADMDEHLKNLDR